MPARLKFLKSEATEWGHLGEWLARSGLALPDVHFDMQRDGRRAWSWPAVSDPRDRAAAVLGEREAAALVPIDHAEGRARVTGLISRPDQHRATSAGIRLFVNRRSVRDRMLQHALIDAYRDLLPRGRFPTAVVFLELPSAAVDVNVHPAKWEVRFADPRGMHRLMRDAVRSSMAQRSWIAAPTPPGATAVREPGTTVRRGGETSPGSASTAEASDWLFAGEIGTGVVRETPVPSAGRVRFGELRLLGQLLATYLLLEAKDQLLLVDQHAAHERVIYERLRAEWLERGVERQALLAPLTVELSPLSFAALTEQADEALRLGFEAEAFGAQTVALRTVPALLADRDPAALLRSLADELAAGEGGLAPESLIRSLAPADRSFATLACLSARRKGDILGPEEQHALLDALDAIPWAPTCPHGRPVAVPVELAEIERRFGRR